MRVSRKKNNVAAKDGKALLEITKYEQYRTIEDLFARSQANTAYYMLLALSAIIIAAGLLLNNVPIVIGGMLVAPVLTPLLLFGLAFSIGEFAVIRRVGRLMALSFSIILVLSFFLTTILGHHREVFEITNTLETALLYFVVAVASGIAGTFALSRKELSEVLPGVAVAISLVPPLALVGIWLSDLNFELARFYLLIFSFNLFGILVGSVVVFSMLGFYQTKEKVELHEEAEAKRIEKRKMEKEKTKR